MCIQRQCYKADERTLELGEAVVRYQAVHSALTWNSLAQSRPGLVSSVRDRKV